VSVTAEAARFLGRGHDVPVFFLLKGREYPPFGGCAASTLPCKVFVRFSFETGLAPITPLLLSPKAQPGSSLLRYPGPKSLSGLRPFCLPANPTDPLAVILRLNRGTFGAARDRVYGVQWAWESSRKRA